MASHNPDIGEDLKILIEISSARDLLIGDFTSSDPYVIVKLDDEIIHTTKHISKDLNPVWGPENENTFILHCVAAKLFDANGLLFEVKDFDLLTSDDPLGTVKIPGNTLCGKFPSVLERAIQPPEGHAGEDVGYLTIRCRPATPEDAESLEKKEHKALFKVKTGIFDH